jgi:hypothetical protein
MPYACDFLPHKGNGHYHETPKAASDCREHWRNQREAKPCRVVDFSPHREPTLEPKYY